jgi:hypothetical protein
MAATRLLVNSRAGDGRLAPGAWQPPTACTHYSEARRMSGTVRMRDVRGGAATTSASVATI